MKVPVRRCRSCGAREFDEATRRRFWSKVQKSDGCWLWMGRVNRNGYGVFDMPGHDGPPRLAHRIAFELAGGEIEDGQYVLHDCDTRPCVRPDHLYSGDQSDNMRDMAERGRGGHTSMPGESNHNAMLTEASVLAIRRMYATGDYTQQALADLFRVSRPLISDVVRRKAWRHVP